MNLSQKCHHFSLPIMFGWEDSPGKDWNLFADGQVPQLAPGSDFQIHVSWGTRLLTDGVTLECLKMLSLMARANVCPVIKTTSSKSSRK